MENNPGFLEREANKLFLQEKYSEAYSLFKKASHIYREKNNFKEAAFCSALAAGCWSIKSGEKKFHNAAVLYAHAAGDALRCGDFEHACLLYKQAAINYEKDREFIDLSDCLYKSREAYRKFLFYSLFKPSKVRPIKKTKEKKGLFSFPRKFLKWLLLFFSFLIWGHGERPSRTLATCLVIILLSAVLYGFGRIIIGGVVSRPGFMDALYFSVITFSTVGFGDVTAVGLSRIVVMVESLSGIFTIPIFIVGFSRKYLRS